MSVYFFLSTSHSSSQLLRYFRLSLPCTSLFSYLHITLTSIFSLTLSRLSVFSPPDRPIFRHLPLLYSLLSPLPFFHNIYGFPLWTFLLTKSLYKPWQRSCDGAGDVTNECKFSSINLCLSLIASQRRSGSGKAAGGKEEKGKGKDILFTYLLESECEGVRKGSNVWGWVCHWGWLKGMQKGFSWEG